MTGDKVVERVVVQDIGNGIAHRTHHMLHRALGMFGIGAVAAFLISRLAHTSNGSERAVQNANDLAEGYLSRRFDQCIAALHSSTTCEQSGPFQREKNLLKELHRDMLALRDLFDRTNSNGQVSIEYECRLYWVRA